MIAERSFSSLLFLCALALTSATQLTASASVVLPGDYNADGVAGLADYTVWRDTLGTSGTADADGNADGTVDITDYSVWQSSYDASYFAASTAAAGLAAPLVAAGPSATLEGTVNGSQIDWTLFFTPADPPSSLGVEFALEMAEGTLIPNSVSVFPDFCETIGGLEIKNPGSDPFVGAVTVGVTEYFDVASPTDGSSVDGIFAALGSTSFSTGGPKAALSFSTTGSFGAVTYSGLIAQGGVIASTVPATTVTVPEPATVGLLFLALIGLSRFLRRR